MTAENVGVARLDIMVSTETMAAEIEKAKRTVGAFGGVAQDSYTKSTNAVNRATDSLAKFVLMQGKSAEEQRLLRAQLQGVPTDKIEMLAAELRSAASAAREVQDSVNFERQRIESQKLFQAAEYVRFWNTQLDAMEAQQAAVANQNNFLASLQQQSNAIGKTRVDLLEMKAAELGVAQAAAPMIAKLREQENALYGTTTKLNAYGLSAKQVQFALRGVPAQITDIFISLQGGQNPLTVLLQQGGQLKDMFGGIAPAASALGGALLKMINPITVAAAVLGTLAVAAFKGDQELRNYSKALIQTGARAGMTADDMASLAASLDRTTISTRSAAAEAVTAAAGVGRFAGAELEKVARSALLMQETIGTAVEDTVKSFVKLADDPVKALVELNKEQNFLTYEIYETVSALTEQGDEMQAARVAIDAYADAVENRTRDLADNLGYLEKAWKGIELAAKDAWDAMLDIGRPATVDETIAKYEQNIASLEETLSKLPADSRNAGKVRNQIAAYRRDLQELASGRIDAAKKSGQEQLAAEANQYAIEISESARQYADKETKKKAELAALEKKFNESSLTFQLQGRLDALEKLESDYAAAREGIEKKYEERSRKKRERRAAESPAVAILGRLNDQIRLNEEAAQSEDKLTASERLAVRVQNDLLEVGKKLSDTERAQIELKLAELKATGDRAKAWAEEVKLKDELLRLTTELTAAEAIARQQANDELAGEGLSDRDRERMKSRLDIERKFVSDVAKLRDKGFAEDTDGWRQQVEILRKHREEMLRIDEDYWNRRKNLEGDWQTGFRRAMAQQRQESEDTAGVSERAFSDAFGALAEMAVDSSKSAQDALTDLATHALKTAARLLAQKAIVALFDMFAGMFGSSSDIGPVQKESVPMDFNAKGGVYKSSDLSSYSGQVVNKPTLFAFAKGAGLMGEAGPEAIMPLTRTSDGKLGVRAEGGGGSGVTVEVNTYIQSDGSSTTETTDNDRESIYREFSKQMAVVAEQKVRDAVRPGGILWKGGVRV